MLRKIFEFTQLFSKKKKAIDEQVGVFVPPPKRSDKRVPASKPGTVRHAYMELKKHREGQTGPTLPSKDIKTEVVASGPKGEDEHTQHSIHGNPISEPLAGTIEKAEGHIPAAVVSKTGANAPSFQGAVGWFKGKGGREVAPGDRRRPGPVPSGISSAIPLTPYERKQIELGKNPLAVMTSGTRSLRGVGDIDDTNPENPVWKVHSGRQGSIVKDEKGRRSWVEQEPQIGFDVKTGLSQRFTGSPSTGEQDLKTPKISDKDRLAQIDAILSTHPKGHLVQRQLDRHVEILGRKAAAREAAAEQLAMKAGLSNKELLTIDKGKKESDIGSVIGASTAVPAVGKGAKKDSSVETLSEPTEPAVQGDDAGEHNHAEGTAPTGLGDDIDRIFAYGLPEDPDDVETYDPRSLDRQ